MKKTLSLVLVLTFFVSLLTFESCKKNEEEVNVDYIEGFWMTTDGSHCEFYHEGGTGKMWDPSEGETEDDATQFDWSFDTNKKMLQRIKNGGETTAVLYCNVLILSNNKFKYKIEGLETVYNMTRVE